MLKCGLFGGLATTLSASLWLGGCRKSNNKVVKIILITIDTLRPDHLGCYGCKQNTSPYLDAFAREAILFENCFSHAPATRCSFASILTGFLPHETQIIKRTSLHPGIETIAGTLQRRGYQTAAVISNYVLRHQRGWNQGFALFDDRMTNQELNRKWPERIAEHTTNRALELLDQYHRDKLFLWIHYQDPHGPYTPPERFFQMFHRPEQKPRPLRVKSDSEGLAALSGRGGIPSYQKLQEHTDYYYYVAQYDGEIRYQDEYLKRLLEATKKYDWYEDALIIITSDHGEGMGERDYYFAHGDNLYLNQTHVPLLIRYGRELTGTRTDMVQHIDIVPTILNVIGGKMDPRLRGRDLRYPQEQPREIFAEMNSPLVKDGIKYSVIWNGQKLIYTPFNKQLEFFDLKKDPLEKNDLIKNSDYRRQIKDLASRLNRLIREDYLRLDDIGKPSSLTEEEKEKLRSLGYVR